MKRTQIFITILLSFLFSSIASAQTQQDEERNRQVKGIKKMQFGIRSGLNVSFPSGNLAEANESRIGYHVGSYIQIPSKKKTFVYEMGLFYSLEGFESALLYGDPTQSALNLPAIGNGALTRIHVEYLDAQFILKDNQSEKFSAYGGLELSYLLSAEIYQEHSNELDELVKYRSSSTDGLSKMAMGILIGMEYHVNHFFHINAQYTYPLTRMISEPATDIKNNTIKLGAGFTF